MMEDINSLKENQDVIDVEAGNTVYDDSAEIDPDSVNEHGNGMLCELPCGALGNDGSENVKSTGIVSVLTDENLRRFRSEEHLPFLEKANWKEKWKTTNPKKSPKPPRPPKGPALSVSDMKLVKEITELNIKKREKMERIRASKKMKAAKSLQQSLSCGTLTAIIVTAVFCFLLIFQGFNPRSSPTASFQGSAETASEPTGWISIQAANNISPNEHAASSKSPSVAELLPPMLRSAGEVGNFMQ